MNQGSDIQKPSRGGSLRRQRPGGVTIIAWYTIVNSLLHAAMFPKLMSTSVGRNVLHAVGIPLSVAIGWACASRFIHILAGVAMLRQHNWGRLLYLSFVPVALFLTVALYGVHLYDVVAIVIYGGFFILLTRPSVAAFFNYKTPKVNGLR